jgi:glutamine synthetase
MKIKLEYIWLDGYYPEPNLRSKVKVIDAVKHMVSGKSLHGVSLEDCPVWSFDGSSTQQAEGSFSDCLLKPVRLIPNPLNEGVLDSYYVLCEVMNSDGTPHETNTRSLLGEEDSDLWFGFEQEYTIMMDGKPLGFPNDGYPEPQGKYYCGVGNRQVNGRKFVEEHMEACIMSGIDITGINAEVMLGQWEYQVFSQGKVKAGDDLWLSRYILQQLSEKYGYTIEFHPKPVKGDWNGSGLHCNFSNGRMRNEGGLEYFESIFKTFDSRHNEHIKCYGSENELRLTGRHETQHISKFSWGISDRGSSIRVPLATSEMWKGYVEDRRPASNADPYRITYVIDESINTSNELYLAIYNMNADVDIDIARKKFGGIITNEELMEGYSNDENFKIDDEVMKANNIPTQEIEFDINSK